jgi:hypothetical protein
MSDSDPSKGREVSKSGIQLYTGFEIYTAEVLRRENMGKYTALTIEALS